MLARRNLQAVLRRLSVLQEHMKIEDQAVFEALFKNVWADHWVFWVSQTKILPDI